MLYDNSRYLALCVIILLCSGYTALFLRIYVRIKRNAWGWDDTIAVIAAVPFAWLCAETWTAANNGLGALSEHITPAMSVQAYKACILFQVAYCTSIVLMKLSIAITLIRIMCGQRILLWILRITVGMFTCITVSVAVYCTLQCRPIAKSWDPTIDGYCEPTYILTALSMTVTVSSIISDLIISSLPIPMLWNLQMDRSSKYASGFLLSLGLFACTCATIRLAYTLALNSTEEYLYQVYGVYVWCFAEVGVAVTVGSLSTLRPLCLACLSGTSIGSSGGRKSKSSRSGNAYELQFDNAAKHPPPNRGQVIPSAHAEGCADAASITTDSNGDDAESGRRILGSSEIRVVKDYRVVTSTSTEV